MISVDNSAPVKQTLEICIAVSFPCTSFVSTALTDAALLCFNKRVHPSHSVFSSGHRGFACTWGLAGIWTQRLFTSSIKISWSLFCLSHTQMVHWFNYTSVLSHTDTRATPDHADAKNKLIWEQVRVSFSVCPLQLSSYSNSAFCLFL